jgi:hypothetical protein
LTTCLSCQTGYYLINTSCVQNCTSASNYLQFTDSTSYICRVCPFPCLTCASNTTTSISYCLSCVVGYLFSGSCPLICPDGTYASFTSIVTCGLCNTSSPYFCSSCTVNATTCTSCQSGYVLYNSLCMSACPSGYFNSSSVCTECLLPCLECLSTAFNCTSCKLGSLSTLSNFGYCPAGTIVLYCRLS